MGWEAYHRSNGEAAGNVGSKRRWAGKARLEIDQAHLETDCSVSGSTRTPEQVDA
jgi:hypothetical protein